MPDQDARRAAQDLGETRYATAARLLLAMGFMSKQRSVLLSPRLGWLGTAVLAAELVIACHLPPGPNPPPVISTTTFDGTVVGVDNRSPAEQLAQGVRVTIAPQGQPAVVVELAPGWYLNKHGLHFSEQDRLSVEGTARPGDPVVLASSVTKGTTSLRLRDAAGRPLWEISDAGQGPE